MSGQRFRTFVTKTGLAKGQLASHEADVLYLKWQQASNSEGSEQPISMSFCTMMSELAIERFADAECPLSELADQAASAGYEC
jgi:hypothetical protein